MLFNVPDPQLGRCARVGTVLEQANTADIDDPHPPATVDLHALNVLQTRAVPNDLRRVVWIRTQDGRSTLSSDHGVQCRGDSVQPPGRRHVKCVLPLLDTSHSYLVRVVRATLQGL